MNITKQPKGWTIEGFFVGVYDGEQRVTDHAEVLIRPKRFSSADQRTYCQHAYEHGDRLCTTEEQAKARADELAAELRTKNPDKLVEVTAATFGADYEQSGNVWEPHYYSDVG